MFRNYPPRNRANSRKNDLRRRRKSLSTMHRRSGLRIFQLDPFRRKMGIVFFYFDSGSFALFRSCRSGTNFGGRSGLHLDDGSALHGGKILEREMN